MLWLRNMVVDEEYRLYDASAHVFKPFSVANMKKT